MDSLIYFQFPLALTVENIPEYTLTENYWFTEQYNILYLYLLYLYLRDDALKIMFLFGVEPTLNSWAYFFTNENCQIKNWDTHNRF